MGTVHKPHWGLHWHHRTTIAHGEDLPFARTQIAKRSTPKTLDRAVSKLSHLRKARKPGSGSSKAPRRRD